MMKIDTNSETPAKPRRTLPRMSMPSLKSARCSDSSVAWSTTSVSGTSAAIAASTAPRSAPDSMATATES